MTGPAVAGPAMDLFNQSRFMEAAIAARAEHTPDSDALAARATLVVAAYQTTDRARANILIDQAIDDAGRAIAAYPGHEEGQLQLAIAVGYHAKLNRSPKEGRDARKLMEKVLRQAPENAYAWALLGGWHGESVADIGSFLAGTVMGARKSEAIRNFEEALRRDPNNPTFPILFAFTLVRLDEKNWPQVRQLLLRASQQKATDGFQSLLQAQGRNVLITLDSAGEKAAKTLVKRYQPFGQILDNVR